MTTVVLLRELPTTKMKSRASEVSMSELQDSSKLPAHCYFGPKECRSRFQLRSDGEGIYLICGNHDDTCVRVGHRFRDKGAVGYYPPIKGAA